MARRTLAVQAAATAALVVAAAGISYAAGSQSRGGQTNQRIDHQTVIWRSEPLTFQDQQWTPLDWARSGNTTVSGGKVLVVRAEGAITVTLSAEVKGGPFALRILDGTHVMRPGIVHVAANPREDAFAFSFVRDGGHPLCGRNLRVQLRPESDAPTVLHRVDLTALYKADTHHSGQTGCV